MTWAIAKDADCAATVRSLTDYYSRTTDYVMIGDIGDGRKPCSSASASKVVARLEIRVKPANEPTPASISVSRQAAVSGGQSAPARRIRLRLLPFFLPNPSWQNFTFKAQGTQERCCAIQQSGQVASSSIWYLSH